MWVDHLVDLTDLAIRAGSGNRLGAKVLRRLCGPEGPGPVLAPQSRSWKGVPSRDVDGRKGPKMTKMKHTTLVTAAALAAALTGFWGCGGSADTTTATGTTAPGAWRSGTGTGTGTTGTVTTGTTLSTAIVDALNEALQDEHRAEAIYRGVLSDFGSVRPFANIVNAEVRHAESIALLFQNHGLAVPASRWTVNNVPHFGTLAEACAAATVAEQENVALYDRYLALDLPYDVRTVFQNNRAASLEMHLPAFQSCPCPNCPAS
jgi:hypothetical protein